MILKEEEMMRVLHREYMRGVDAGRLVRCRHSSRVLFLYRLSVVFSSGVIFAFIVHKF